MDLEKAYDRVDWAFCKEILQAVGFNSKMTQLILFCIQSTKLYLLWNGEKLEEFTLREDKGKGIPFPVTFLSFAWRY